MTEAKGGATSGVHSRSLGHHTRSIATRWAGIARVLAQHVEDVAKVEANSTHAQQQLGIAKRRSSRLRFEEEVADQTTGVEVQPHQPLGR